MEGADWVAIGDAAASYDPLAAQGIHKALTDGILVADKIATFFNEGTYVANSFSAYVKKRYAAYLQNRSYSYGLEQRWADAPFWQNRQKAGKLS